MNVLVFYVQRCRWLRLAVALATIPAMAWAQAPAASNEPNSASLAGARELFLAATDDFDEGHVEEALAKFQRVATVRETAQVRYNIAKCQSSLGRLATALADFERAEREAPADAKGNAIAKLAHEQAAAIRTQVPRLTVACDTVVAGVSVSVDGQAIPPASFDVPLPLDPGPHLVEATAPGRGPFRQEVQLAQSQSLRVVVDFPEATAQAPAAVPATESPPAPAGDASHASNGLPPRTWAYVAIGTGVALGAASLIFTVLERSEASDVTSSCPDTSRCNVANRAAVESSQSTGRRDEVLALGFGAASLVALGVGTYLWLRAPPPPRTSASAYTVRFEPASRGALLGGSLVAAF